MSYLRPVRTPRVDPSRTAAPRPKRRGIRLKAGALATVAAAALFASAPAHAVIAIGNNTIIGVFSAPIYAGNVLNNPSPGKTTSFDNTASAPATTVISNGGSTLQWGTGPDLNIPLSEQSSQVTFSGASGLPAVFTTPMQIGTINFLNGTSDLNSLIFGATLSFYLNSAQPGNLVGTDTVIINTTSNQYGGTGLTQAHLQTDADYLNICGNDSSICNSSIEAYEASEGGTGVTVNLSGTLDDLVLTSVSLAPNQDPNTSGTVGSLAPLALLPEPASFALLGTGLLFLLGSRRRKQQHGASGRS